MREAFEAIANDTASISPVDVTVRLVLALVLGGVVASASHFHVRRP